MMQRETRTRGIRRAGSTLSALAALLAIGCGRSGPGIAEVQQFHLGAGGALIDEGNLFICSGEAVTASWVTVESSHNALLINGRYQDVSLLGPYMEPSVTTTTWFRLDATGNAPRSDANMSSRVETANVQRGGERMTFAGPSACSPYTATWHATSGPLSNRYSNRLRVGAIFNTSGRVITVSNGRHPPQTLRPMDGTGAFDGDPLSGPWTIDGEVFGTEACFDSSGNPQAGPWLSFVAETRC